MRKFTPRSTERFAAWAETASEADVNLATEAMFHVLEDTWRQHNYAPDATHSLTFHVLVKPDLVLTVRFAQEYPDVVQLIYVGPV